MDDRHILMLVAVSTTYLGLQLIKLVSLRSAPAARIELGPDPTSRRSDRIHIT